MRDHWREFDPIGVYSLDPPWPPDEYDAYVDGCLRLLEKETGVTGIAEHLRSMCEETMGLGPAPASHYAAFAKRLQEWYDGRWPGTLG